MGRRHTPAQAVDRDHAAAQLVRFVLGATAAGIVHADPDPEDVLVLPDGRLAILDFGAWRELDRDRVILSPRPPLTRSWPAMSTGSPAPSTISGGSLPTAAR